MSRSSGRGPEKEDDRAEQIQLVQSAVASGVDGIVLAPLDARALVEPVETAVAKGIPVVIIDSGARVRTRYVSLRRDRQLPRRRAGRAAAGRSCSGGRARSSCSVTRSVPRAPSSARRGSTETMAKDFPKITFVSDSEYAGPTSDSRSRSHRALVTRYRGQVDGIFCPNETSTVGMLRALEGAGMLAGRLT